MRTHTITIETQSYILPASGEGDALIDADIIQYDNGFPFIPARRFKGLLRESMMEVLEMGDRLNPEDEVNKFLGKADDINTNGYLQFDNAYVVDWNNLKSSFKKWSCYFSLASIKRHYTTEIQQTKIEDGKAAKGSLRSYRVLNPENIFIMKIHDVSDGSSDQLLKEALLNLRYMGTRRNRGFGKIKCRLKETLDSSLNVKTTERMPQGDFFIEVHIKLQAPVVLAHILGDQNTVFSESFIPGNRIRGLFADIWLKSNAGKSQSDFNEIFHSGKVLFQPATLEGTRPIRLNWHKYKGVDAVKDVFETAENTVDNDIRTKSIGGIGSGITQQMPVTTFFFHHARKEHRIAGRSEDAEIFYYQSLQEDQEFIGAIYGNAKELTSLYQQYNSFTGYIGKSRSAQYGRVTVNLHCKLTSEKENKIAGQYIVIAQSPLLLYNQYGLAQPNKDCLKTTLEAVLNLNDIVITKAAARYAYVEQYNRMWASKTTKAVAYKEGSSFVIESKTGLADGDYLIGAGNEEGYGYITIKPFNVEEIKQYEFGNIDTSNHEDEAMSAQDKEALPPLLKGILKKAEDEKENAVIKTLALINAKNQKESKPKNHLIGRLLDEWKTAQDGAGITAFIATLKGESDKGKPAFNTIKDAKWLNREENYFINPDPSKVNSFDAEKLYWTTFLATLRKLKVNE